MGGTRPKITKRVFSIDEKMHISSRDAQKSQSKSNLLRQKTKPKPPKQQIENKPCEKLMVRPCQNCGLHVLITPCGITFPKNKLYFMWGVTD